jgi:hypothetical protein
MCDNRLLDDAEILQPEHFANGRMRAFSQRSAK